MIGYYRCMWFVVGSSPCGKEATHGTMLANGTFYLCTYHAGRGKRDGWSGVKPLKKAGAA